MACGSCGGNKTSKQYPYDAVMPDGSRQTVTSAADERIQRERVNMKIRQDAAAKGYSVRNA